MKGVSGLRTVFVVMICSCALLSIAIVDLFEPIVMGIGEWLEVETPDQSADIVVALGGDRRRQDEAVAILKSGRARQVLFVGGDIQPHDYSCLEVPAELRLLQPRVAYTTFEEALTVREVVNKHQFRSVIVVTSPYHLRRALWTFRKVFADSEVTLLVAPSPNAAFSLNDWWKSYIGRKTVILEYLGLGYYWLTAGNYSIGEAWAVSGQAA